MDISSITPEIIRTMLLNAGVPNKEVDGLTKSDLRDIVVGLAKKQRRVTANSFLKRLSEGVGVHIDEDGTQTDVIRGVATKLGVSEGAIRQQMDRNTVPTPWIHNLLLYYVNPNWVSTGEGKKYLIPSDVRPDIADIPAPEMKESRRGKRKDTEATEATEEDSSADSGDDGYTIVRIEEPKEVPPMSGEIDEDDTF